jgi:hypothetical protein
MAGTLRTGVVRDTDGAAIVGARVRAIDAAGRTIGSDRAASDGTFALDIDGEPTALEVSCAYCVTTRVIARADESIVFLMRRYAVLRDAPLAPADLAALPYRRFSQIATLAPYVVANGSEISDRGLDRGHGALVLEGIPLYRATDGASTSDLIVPVALTEMFARSPLDAPRYGTYAQGGLFDVRAIGAPSARIDGGDAFDLATRASARALRATYAVASDAGGRRGDSLVAADLPFAGGTLSARALALSDADRSLAGAMLGYATASRRALLSSHLAVRSSVDSSLVDGAASLRSRGTLPVEFSVRAARSTGILADGSTGTQSTQALALGVEAHGGASDTRVTIAYERGGNALAFNSSFGSALTASASEDVRLGERFSVQGGVLTALRTPTLLESESAISGDRSVLIQTRATYTDNARLRVGAVAYSERITSGRHLSGIGIDGTWQIAPALALRAWTLAMSTSSGVPYPRLTPASPNAHRQVVWFTAGEALRIDLLARGGPLEGDIRVPFGAYAATVGSSMQAGVRVTTLGIGAR